MEIVEKGDLLRALMQGEGEPKFTHGQVLERLKTVYDALTEEPETFKPGDPVLHKFPSVSTTRYSEYPGLFMRYLDDPIRSLDQATQIELGDMHLACATHVLDCEILLFGARGEDGSAAVFLCNSQEYRKYDKDRDNSGGSN